MLAALPPPPVAPLPDPEPPVWTPAESRILTLEQAVLRHRRHRDADRSALTFAAIMNTLPEDIRKEFRKTLVLPSSVRPPAQPFFDPSLVTEVLEQGPALPTLSMDRDGAPIAAALPQPRFRARLSGLFNACRLVAHYAVQGDFRTASHAVRPLLDDAVGLVAATADFVASVSCCAPCASSCVAVCNDAAACCRPGVTVMDRNSTIAQRADVPVPAPDPTLERYPVTTGVVLSEPALVQFAAAATGLEPGLVCTNTAGLSALTLSRAMVCQVPTVLSGAFDARTPGDASVVLHPNPLQVMEVRIFEKPPLQDVILPALVGLSLLALPAPVYALTGLSTFTMGSLRVASGVGLLTKAATTLPNLLRLPTSPTFVTSYCPAIVSGVIRDTPAGVADMAQALSSAARRYATLNLPSGRVTETTSGSAQAALATLAVQPVANGIPFLVRPGPRVSVRMRRALGLSQWVPAPLRSLLSPLTNLLPTSLSGYLASFVIAAACFNLFLSVLSLVLPLSALILTTPQLFAMGFSSVWPALSPYLLPVLSIGSARLLRIFSAAASLPSRL